MPNLDIWKYWNRFEIIWEFQELVPFLISNSLDPTLDSWIKNPRCVASWGLNITPFSKTGHNRPLLFLTVALDKLCTAWRRFCCVLDARLRLVAAPSPNIFPFLPCRFRTSAFFVSSMLSMFFNIYIYIYTCMTSKENGSGERSPCATKRRSCLCLWHFVWENFWYTPNILWCEMCDSLIRLHIPSMRCMRAVHCSSGFFAEIKTNARVERSWRNLSKSGHYTNTTKLTSPLDLSIFNFRYFFNFKKTNTMWGQKAEKLPNPVITA